MINYTKDIEQPVPISAKILAPEIICTKEVVDFGTSLVGQERCQQFFIRNPSSSSLIWTIDISNL